MTRVYAYKAPDGSLWDTEGQALDREVLVALLDRYNLHPGMGMGFNKKPSPFTDTRELYGVLHKFYGGKND